MSDEDVPVVLPPSSMTVDEPVRKPVLYRADGTPLVKRPAGFDTTGCKRRTNERHIRTVWKV